MKFRKVLRMRWEEVHPYSLKKDDYIRMLPADDREDPYIDGDQILRITGEVKEIEPAGNFAIPTKNMELIEFTNIKYTPKPEKIPRRDQPNADEDHC